jgi:hypothetical protein
MKYITKLSSLATATGLGTLLISGVTGCSSNTQQYEEEAKAKGAFVIIEETAPGKYQIKDEFPADETRIVLKKLDGTEEVLTQAQLDTLIKEEAAKIDNGTSTLTKEQNPQAQHQGMGLGETIMASMAGAMLGAWIGNKLFGNQNYKNNRKAGYKSPSTYSKSKKSFSKPRRSSTKKGGFFGNKKSSARKGGFFGG